MDYNRRIPRITVTDQLELLGRTTEKIDTFRTRTHVCDEKCDPDCTTTVKAYPCTITRDIDRYRCGVIWNGGKTRCNEYVDRENMCQEHYQRVRLSRKNCAICDCIMDNGMSLINHKFWIKTYKQICEHCKIKMNL